MEKPTNKELLERIMGVLTGFNGDEGFIQRTEKRLDKLDEGFNDFNVNRADSCPMRRQWYRNIPLVISSAALFFTALGVTKVLGWW